MNKNVFEREKKFLDANAAAYVRTGAFKLSLQLLAGLVILFTVSSFNNPTSVAASVKIPRKITLEQKIDIIRKKYTPSIEKGPFWTPADFPRYTMSDDYLVPFHESVADIKIYPLQEWLPVQQRSFSPGYESASFFLRPPDWVATYTNAMNADMIDIRGPIIKNKKGKKTNGVWASVTLNVSPRYLPERPWMEELSYTGDAEEIIFSDGSEGIWIRAVPSEDTHGIKPPMRQKIYRLTKDNYIVDAELRATFPQVGGRLPSSSIFKPGKVDPVATDYYEKILRFVVENFHPKPVTLPEPKVVNIKNCQAEPFWMKFKYGDEVIFKNLDARRHTLYGIPGNEIQFAWASLPPGGQAKYEVDVPPRLWASLMCDQSMGGYIPLLTPGPLAGFITVEPEAPVPGNVMVIKKCRSLPYRLRVGDGEFLTIQNTDNVPHTLVVSGDIFHKPIQQDMSDRVPGVPPPPPSPSSRTVIKIPAHESVTKRVFILGGGIAMETSFECDGKGFPIRFMIAKPEFDSSDSTY